MHSATTGILNCLSAGSEEPMSTDFYRDDIPDGFEVGDVLAVDTETTGLKLRRDRLCLVQMSRGDGHAVLVQIRHTPRPAPNLLRLLQDPGVLKVFHFARADIAFLLVAFGVLVRPVYCTKIASRLARTNSSQHGLKALVMDLLGVELAKEQQSSDWAADSITDQQMEYAASDVLHLHCIRELLNRRLVRDRRMNLAEACFDFLPERARLDVAGWQNDIFSH